MERTYIKLYSTLFSQNGYNLDSGGKVNKTHSEETKRKISASNTGKYPSTETRKKISENRKGKTCGENHYMWGKHLSKEHIEILRENASSRRGEDRIQSRKVICLNTMEVFPSIRSAAQKYNCDEVALSRCCSGKRYNYCGTTPDMIPLQWAFYEEGKEYVLKENVKLHIQSMPVEHYDLNMNLIQKYNSVSKASKATGISNYNILKICRGEKVSENGNVFKFAS